MGGGRTDRQRDVRTDRQTDRETDRQTDRETDIHTDRQTDRKTDKILRKITLDDTPADCHNVNNLLSTSAGDSNIYHYDALLPQNTRNHHHYSYMSTRT